MCSPPMRTTPTNLEPVDELNISKSPPRVADGNASMSPGRSGDHAFQLPSPVPTRRNRTFSASERARKSDSYTGTVKTFCRQQGHGFILPDEGGPALFVHISDIDGEYVPHAGDEVRYRRITIPPKNVKYQAVHVEITHLKPGEKHETWDSMPANMPESISPR